MELSGGKSYPVLTALLGAAAGPVSGLGALLFSAATTAISSINPIQNVQVRLGDEIWQVEQIGKSKGKAVYGSVFFIVDPFRRQVQNKGWLIHEEWSDLSLN